MVLEKEDAIAELRKLMGAIRQRLQRVLYVTNSAVLSCVRTPSMDQTAVHPHKSRSVSGSLDLN